MNDYRDRISSDASNDVRWNLYQFTRDSKIPHGTFDSRINIDAVVVGGVIICLAVGLLAVWIGEMLT